MYTNIQHNNNQYGINEEEREWTPAYRPPSSPSFPLYPELYNDEIEYRERELEREIQGREQWGGGVETQYPTTPYPPPPATNYIYNNNNNNNSNNINVNKKEERRVSLTPPEPWMPPPAKWYQRQSFLKPLGIFYHF